MSQYGHESKDLRQARLLECTRRLTNLNCVSREKTSTFVLELDHLFGEFEALDCEYPEPLKKLTLMERIEGAAPDVYVLHRTGKYIFRVIHHHGTPIVVYRI